MRPSIFLFTSLLDIFFVSQLFLMCFLVVDDLHAGDPSDIDVCCVFLGAFGFNEIQWLISDDVDP